MLIIKIIFPPLFFLFTAISCSSVEHSYLTTEDDFDCPYVSFNAPANNWYVFNRDWHINETNTSCFKKIYNNQPYNGSLEIEVASFSKVNDRYFDADYDFSESFERYRSSDDRIERHREQGIRYYNTELAYFQGMRCTNSVFSRSYGGSAYSASSKDYTLACGYYHKSEGPRLLIIGYNYYGASDVSTHLVKDSDASKTPTKPISDAETLLKRDLLQVLASIEIKDVDWQRMQDEGLIHDEPFVNTQW